MKQYLNSEQTATLIELGFAGPSPKWVKDENGDYRVKTNDADYDIGELLSFLPKEIKVEKYEEPAYLQMLYDEDGVWEVGYTFYGNGMTIKRDIEFIDCLFQMCIRLKEEGVI